MWKRPTGGWGRMAALASVVALLSLAACGGTEEASDTSQQVADEEPQVEVVAFPVVSVPYFGLEYIADALELDLENGIDLDILQAQILGVTGVQPLLEGDSYTIQGLAVDGGLKAIQGGVDIVAVVEGYRAGGEFDIARYYARAGSEIDGPEDLVGKRVGIPNLGAYADTILDVYLQQADIDPGDVERIAVPHPELGAALLNEQVDVIGLHDAFYSQLEASHDQDVRQVFADTDVAPSEDLLSVYWFTTSFIEEEPELVGRFVATMKAAAKAVQEDPERAREIIADVTGQDAASIVIPAYSPNQCIDEAAAAAWVSILEEQGSLEGGSVPEGAWFTNEFNDDCT